MVADSGKIYKLFGKVYYEFPYKIPPSIPGDYINAVIESCPAKETTIYYYSDSIRGRLIAQQESSGLIALLPPEEIEKVVGILRNKGYNPQNLYSALPFLFDINPFISLEIEERPEPAYSEVGM